MGRLSERRVREGGESSVNYKQAYKELLQAKERVRLARREETRCILIYNTLQAQHIREIYNNKPFKERLPRIKSGRPRDDEEQHSRNIHHRMIYLELLQRKEETGKPIISHAGPSLVEDMAAEIHLSEAAIRKSWRLGQALHNIEVI